jgi:hypothetical protein
VSPGQSQKRPLGDRREQLAHLGREVLETVTEEMRRRERHGEVAGQDAVAVPHEVRYAGGVHGPRLAEAARGEHVLDRWPRTGAVPWPARSVEPRYFATSARISACGTGGGPGLGGTARPFTVWTTSATDPPGSSRS